MLTAVNGTFGCRLCQYSRYFWCSGLTFLVRSRVLVILFIPDKWRASLSLMGVRTGYLLIMSNGYFWLISLSIRRRKKNDTWNKIYLCLHMICFLRTVSNLLSVCRLYYPCRILIVVNLNQGKVHCKQYRINTGRTSEWLKSVQQSRNFISLFQKRLVSLWTVTIPCSLIINHKERNFS